MSMVHCRACGHSLHVTAPACPKCSFLQASILGNGSGHAAIADVRGQQNNFFIGFIVAAAFVLCIGIGVAAADLEDGASGAQVSRQVADPSPDIQTPARAMSDEEAEDATADSMIQQISNHPSPHCASIADFMRQAWSMHVQMGRHPGYKTNFFRAMEQAEKRGCL